MSHYYWFESHDGSLLDAISRTFIHLGKAVENDSMRDPITPVLIWVVIDVLAISYEAKIDIEQTISDKMEINRQRGNHGRMK